MRKVLFLIHDLGQGGAEKVLVNLVNNLNPIQFEINVIALFGGGVNEKNLKPHIHYRVIFHTKMPGNSHLMKLLTPAQLHRWIIRDHYDIEISYLEGPCARIISGCQDIDTKLVTWIHSTIRSERRAAASFRSNAEMQDCYSRFHRVICVSEDIERSASWLPADTRTSVLYNTLDTKEIRRLADEKTLNLSEENCPKLLAVGSLKQVKGYDRLLRVCKRLHESGDSFHLYILGTGPLGDELSAYVKKNHLERIVTFLGYQMNPYKYMAKCDLLVCSSYSEGFSTVVMEAMIVGTPICTVEVSGMRELLGSHGEYGIITDNSEDALYEGIQRLLRDPELLSAYRKLAIRKGNCYDQKKTVKAVESMLQQL